MSANRLAIEGELTIFNARELQARLLAALAQEDDLEVDLSGVSDIDCAGIQLMVSAKRHALEHDRCLRFVGHSPAVVATLDLCELSAYFGDPVLIPRA